MYTNLSATDVKAMNFSEVSEVDNETMEGVAMEKYPNPFDHMSVRVTFIAIYSIVFVACILGK